MAITAKLLKRRFPVLLGRFEHGELETLLEALVPIEVPAGEQLHCCGDHADSLYLIWEGNLSLSMKSGGEDIPLGNLGSGQHIGSVAVIEPGPAPTTVMVAEPSTLLRLDYPTLVVLRTTHQQLAGHLLRTLSLDLVERLRFYEEGMAGRTQPPANPEEFAQLCRPLMGVKTG